MHNNLTSANISYTLQVDSNDDRATLIYWLTGYFFIGCVSLIGHVLIAIIILRHMTLNYSPYYLLINLGVCDVGYSFLSMLLGIIAVKSNNFVLLADAQNIARIAFFASLFTLCCLSFDRVLAVRFTLSYQFFARRKTPALMVAVSWVAGILMNIIVNAEDRSDENQGVPLRYSSFLYLGVIISFGILFVALCLLYIHMATLSQMNSLRNSTPCMYGEAAEQYHCLENRKQINYDITIVSLFSMATLLPANFLFLKIYISPSSADKKLLLFNWGMGAIYTAVNPFVYLRVMRKLRELFATDMIRTKIHWKKKTSNRVEPVRFSELNN